MWPPKIKTKVQLICLCITLFFTLSDHSDCLVNTFDQENEVVAGSAFVPPMISHRKIKGFTNLCNKNEIFPEPIKKEVKVTRLSRGVCAVLDLTGFLILSMHMLPHLFLPRLSPQSFSLPTNFHLKKLRFETLFRQNVNWFRVGLIILIILYNFMMISKLDNLI